MLKVNHIQISSVNGPGERLVIWLQGCLFGCAGCFNKNMQPLNGGIQYSVYDLYRKIIEYHKKYNFEGITYSGGEPFLQACELTELSCLIKRKGLSICSYSGYTLSEIKENSIKCGLNLLNYLDILIDGLYMNELSANLLWRGSSNQKVHFLTDRYNNWKDKINIRKKQIEFFTEAKGTSVTGIFNEDFISKLKIKIDESKQ